MREIAEDFLAGAELAELAAEFGIWPVLLETHLAAAGFWPVGDLARRYWRHEPVSKIATVHAMTERQVYRLLDRHGVARRGRRRELPVPSAELARQYLVERRELQDIGAALGVSARVVSRRLRDDVGVRVPVGSRPIELPVQELRRRRDAGTSLVALAAEYQVSVPTIRARVGLSQPYQLPVDELRRRHRAGESLTSLATAYGVSPDTIRRRVKTPRPQATNATPSAHLDEGADPAAGRVPC
ncbi:LysM peptidoglycan-binding domain-containing protein (plasmid) [Streptomyces sp. Q6]|uniref:LysM peptidoglycan-binding domain-containing protein n=1 Tax=Streptomyces citrinus TaxID=3118173 RepID=A0ACD5AQ83_9ACTN